MKVKSQEFSELDIGGRETCSILLGGVTIEIKDIVVPPHFKNFRNIYKFT